MFSSDKKNSNNSISDVDGNVHIGDNFYPEGSVSGFRKKVLSAINSKETVDTYFRDLELLIRGKTEEHTIGLERKLTNGGFDSIVERALETKEKFVLVLEKSQFSIGYQKIIYAAIDEAISKFTYSIRPMIDKGESKDVILGMISEKIFDSLFNDVADLEEFTFDKASIEGLVYFLTGNCLLRWAK